MPVTNPFYRTNSSNPPPTNPTNPTSPPAYRNVPPPPVSNNGPVTYSSLSDLNKGRTVPQPPQGGYTYTPDASRNGYRSSGFEDTSSGGFGGAQSGNAGGVTGGRRNMPPPPSNYGVDIPREPPRRNVPGRPETTDPPARTTAPQSRFQQAQTTAAGYIPNSVSATATSLGDRMKDGFDSIATQQRKEQVVSGAGKVAAGAAKLAGKAAWSLGKFASGSK